MRNAMPSPRHNSACGLALRPLSTLSLTANYLPPWLPCGETGSLVLVEKSYHGNKLKRILETHLKTLLLVTWSIKSTDWVIIPKICDQELLLNYKVGGGGGFRYRKEPYNLCHWVGERPFLDLDQSNMYIRFIMWYRLPSALFTTYCGWRTQ